MESPSRLPEKARPADDDTVICRSSFSARSKMRGKQPPAHFLPSPAVTGITHFLPSPAVTGITHYTLYQSPCASRSLWTPESGQNALPVWQDIQPPDVRYVRYVRYFGGIPLSHFYRTYRTLPYTFPPQKDNLSILRAPGTVADAVLLQQVILPHVQRPHDPVW